MDSRIVIAVDLEGKRESMHVWAEIIGPFGIHEPPNWWYHPTNTHVVTQLSTGYAVVYARNKHYARIAAERIARFFTRPLTLDRIEAEVKSALADLHQAKVVWYGSEIKHG